MMPDSLPGFGELESWLESAVMAMSPATRKKMMRVIARQVRRQQQKRITRQTDPDGDKWQARSDRGKRPGNIKAATKMMLGFRKARRMAITANADQATIGFKGKTAAIASVHHHGSIDEVEKGGPRIKYPQRRLLGLPPEDLRLIRQILIDHTAPQ